MAASGTDKTVFERRQFRRLAADHGNRPLGPVSTHCGRSPELKQGDMLRSAPRPALAVTFFVWFALWFVAGRYISIDFYRLTFGEAVQSGFGPTTLLVAFVLMIVPVMRPCREQIRWSYALLCIGLLTTVEVVWRLVMNMVLWDVAKGVGLVLHLSTPALLAFGVAAAIAEWRGRKLEATAITIAA